MKLFHCMKRLMVAAMLTALFASTAHALPESCLTKAEAEAITFKWKDASGTTHTASLADRATDPRHIIALLKEVYTNKNVPGIYYRGYTNTFANGGAVYYTYAIKCGWNISNANVKPNKEGYTLLILSVKDDFNGTAQTYNAHINDSEAKLIAYIESAIESAQLITDGKRMGNAAQHTSGTAFSISGNFNRFFFLSKGKCLASGATPNYPFYTMFEQFSPNNVLDHTTVTDFYERMVSGEKLPIEHDCSSVLESNHYFRMNGNSNDNTRYDMTGLNLFIPDYRLTAWGTKADGRDFGGDYHNYNSAYTPQTFMYAIILKGDAEQLSETDHTYTVTLDWRTTYNTDANQTFDIYRVVDGVIEDTPIVTGLQNTYSWSTTVDQETHGYTLTYVVRGRPDDADFDRVTSNQVSVVIPGYDPQERLTLTISGEHESTYMPMEQVNQYVNRIIMNNGEGTSVTREFLAADSKLELHRYEQGSTTPDLVVATVTITDVTDSNCHYTVTYDHQTGADESKYPAKQGTFTFDDKGNVQFNDFMICDQFNADTKKNAQRTKYTYQVLFESAKQFEDIDGNLTNQVYSNATDVNIYKVEYELESETFTAEQVAADTDGKNLLPITDKVIMKCTAQNDRIVLNYNLNRSEEVNPTSVVAYAQNTNDDNYKAHNADGTEVVWPAAQLQVSDDLNGASAGTFTYVPVIETYRNDGSGNRNTYGADVKVVKHNIVNAEVTDPFKSTKTFDKGPGRYYTANLKGTISLADGMAIDRIRVWRFCDDAKEEQERYMERLEQSKAIYDGPAEQSFLLDGDKMVFGAEDKDNIVVTYVVRLYAIETTSAGANAPMRAPEQARYTISEQTIRYTFTGDVLTGITDLTTATPTAADVVSRRYVNVQGQVSNTPWRGLNVVVSTLSNGTIATGKMVN